MIPNILKIDIPAFLTKGNNKIRIRGTVETGLYFSVISVSKVLDVPNIENIVKLYTSIYYALNDYVEFTINNNITMYFTEEGFIKYLYNSNNTKAKDIRNWIKSLYKSDTKKNYIKRLGCDAVSLKQTLCLTSHVSCIYLIIILFEKGHYIVKIGYTNNLKRRLTEHIKDFIKINKITETIYVKYYRYIDAEYVKQAENDLKQCFCNYAKIEAFNTRDYNQKRTEVYKIPENDIINVLKCYDTLGLKYGSEINALKKDIKKQSEELAFKLELQKLEYECNIKCLEKDIENLKLKLQIVNSLNSLNSLK